MQDSASKRPPQVNDATGSWRPAEAVVPAQSIDPPTVRSGQAGEGSSLANRAVATSMPQPGERLESFELERSIGVGGMGAVFLAIDTRLHREVALKILPPEQSSDSEVVQRFYQEGRAAARLDHENIARVFTIGTDKGYHYIAFEYIEGQTLRQRVHEHGPLPVDEAINYTLQIAGALVHASERGVVHRDIKPSNIIITPQGRAKLVDMGLARRFERGDDDGLTQSGMTLGTFDYISPEQARDPRDVDVRGDLYSLGCTLFHMLTGRPPFPEGTVLQKLLQHQEEPPPDVRKLNAHVSDDLAAILSKLMAKDRDRRYQTPELLARDLLTVAGALGLRSLSPEGLVWMSPKSPPLWEKHLVWGLPAAALIAVVGFLFWWGQPIEPSPTANDSESLGTIGSAPPKVLPTDRPDPSVAKPELTRSVSPVVPNVTVVKPSTPPPAPPREVEVSTSEELTLALANEASGSTVILDDDGPYLLRPAAIASSARRDLTIKASPDKRPVIRPARSAVLAAEESQASLLSFGPGRVTIQDVEFQVDPPESDASWSAIRTQGTDLTLKRCTMRAPAGLRTRGQLAAVLLEPGPSKADQGQDRTLATTIWADACHFEGGQVGIRARGAADLRVRDCTFAVALPAFWLDNGSGTQVVPVDVALRYVSIRPGREPVFRLSQSKASIVVDHSVIANSNDREAILVTMDRRDRLDWRGRSNLYGGLGTYLQETQGLTGSDPIRQFGEWSDDPGAFREVDSVASTAPVWLSPETTPGTTSSRGQWEFALRPRGRPDAVVLGARQTPQGSVASVSALGTAYVEAPQPPQVESVVNPFLARTDPESGTGLNPASDANPRNKLPTSNSPLVSLTNDPDNALTEGLKPMPVAPMGIDAADPANATRPRNIDIEKPPVERSVPDRVLEDPSLVRTVESLKAEIARLADRGGVIRLAGDADLVLPSLEITGPGRIVIEAPTGENRPILRFRYSRTPGKGPRDRHTLFQILAGSLELRRIDVVLEQAEAPEDAAWEAFALRSGTDLVLNRCTVSVSGGRGKTVMASLNSTDDPIGGGLLDFEAAARIRATDCLLRSDGDLVNIESGRKLDLELNNCMVGTSGSLVHGHGLIRGSTPETLKIGLTQVSARLMGGLVHLESKADEPELPLADVTARDTVLTTGDQAAPLIRFDGQDELDLLQDRLRWDGNGVVYHGIDVYRRHQTSQTGTVPQNFDRHSWEVAVGASEKMPIHGDAAFLKPVPAGRSGAEIDRDDLRRSADAPAPSSGADWRKIPEPPRPRSL